MSSVNSIYANSCKNSILEKIEDFKLPYNLPNSILVEEKAVYEQYSNILSDGKIALSTKYHQKKQLEYQNQLENKPLLTMVEEYQNWKDQKFKDVLKDKIWNYIEKEQKQNNKRNGGTKK